MSKKEPLNARHVRSSFEAKEAMQYANASIFMGELIYDFAFVPTEGVACLFRQKQYRRKRRCVQLHSSLICLVLQ